MTGAVPAGGERDFLLAQSLHNAGGDLAAALTHYDAALREGFDRYWVLTGRARLHRDLGQHWHASRDFLLAALSRPVSRGTPALLRQATGMALKRPRPAPPTEDWIATRERLWALFHAGDFPGVVTEARAMTGAVPAGGERDFLLAQSLHNAGGDLAAALVHYDAALHQGFDRYWVLTGRARLHRDLGQHWRASRDFLLAALARPASRGTPGLLRQAAGMAIRPLLPRLKNSA